MKGERGNEKEYKRHRKEKWVMKCNIKEQKQMGGGDGKAREKKIKEEERKRGKRTGGKEKDMEEGIVSMKGKK